MKRPVNLGIIKIFIFGLFWFSGQNLYAVKIQSGPILFHHSQDEYAIWYMSKGNSSEIPPSILIQEREVELDTASISCADKSCVFQYIVKKSFFSDYDSLSIVIYKDIPTKYIKNPEVQEYRYLIGSCAFNWSQFGRLFFPGNGFRIFNNMQSVNNRGMIWLGDNLYYLFLQTKSFERMYSKQKKIRKNRFINDFLQSTLQSAVWDDHDYGPNNSDRNFKNKKDGIEVFQAFWPAPYNKNIEEGNYFTLRDKYAKYYYLDDRYFKSEDLSEGMFGAKQMEWLKNELLSSEAEFNIIISGSQMLNVVGKHERFAEYENEFNELFDFLNEAKINGVIFLSGDVHYSAVYHRNDLLSYPVHEFTCSPLSSFPNKVRKRDVRYQNQSLLNDMRYDRQSFGSFEFNEVNGVTIFKLSLYNGKGNMIWEHEIAQDEINNTK